MPQVVAIACCVILAGLVVFQVVLLAGAPLARFAWGGEDHYLQPRFRRSAVTAVAVCLLGAFVALQGAGIAPMLPAFAARVASIVFVVLFFAAFVVTARSRSRVERRLMCPTFVALAALFLIIALAGRPG